MKIDRPGRDAKVNPIEEVTITVNAEDDFALNEVALHYSVNGGAEKTVQLLPQKGAKTASGKYVLALEDYKLAPGDLVSIYADAKDARNTTKTDIYFIQAEPLRAQLFASAIRRRWRRNGRRRQRSADLAAAEGHHRGDLERV